MRPPSGSLPGSLYEFDSQGRMKIESKEQARARGVPSPDRAEALMLHPGQPPQLYEYYSERDLPRLGSRDTRLVCMLPPNTAKMTTGRRPYHANCAPCIAWRQVLLGSGALLRRLLEESHLQKT